MSSRLIAASLTVPALLGLLPGQDLTPARAATRAEARADPHADPRTPQSPPYANPASSPPAAAALDPGIAQLIDAAQLWSLRQRLDLARGVLNKVLAMQADEPRALLMLGELDLRAARKDAPLAQLSLLQRHHPDSRELRELQQLAVLYSIDRSRLTRLRQMVDTDRLPDAARLAREMFPDARPPGLFGAELAGLLASTPGGWEPSRRAAAARVANTGTALDRLALAEVLALRPSRVGKDPTVSTGYPALMRDTRLPRDVVAASWRRAIRLQPATAGTSGPMWQAYKLAMATPESPAAASAATAALASGQASSLGSSLASGPASGPGLGQTPAARERIPTPAPASATAQPQAPEPPPDPIAQAREARSRALAEARRLAQDDLDARIPQAAADRLATALERWGDDGVGWGLYGIAQLRLDRHAVAAPAFDRAARLDADGAASWTRLARLSRYWGAVTAARGAAQAGDDALVVALLEPVLPPRVEPPDRAIEAQLLQAAALGRQGPDGLALALERYRQVLAVAPDESRAIGGLFALQLGADPDAALSELQALAGDRAGRYVSDGDVRAAVERRRAEQGDDAAQALLDHALAVAPERAWLRYDAARHHLARRDPARARAEMAAGLAAAPEQDAMREAAAEIALQADQPDAALVLLARWVDGPLPSPSMPGLPVPYFQLPLEATAAGLRLSTGREPARDAGLAAPSPAALDTGIDLPVDPSAGAAAESPGDASRAAAAAGAISPDAGGLDATSATPSTDPGAAAADALTPARRSLIRRARYALALDHAQRALEAEQVDAAREALDRADIESDGEVDTRLHLARLRLRAGQPGHVLIRLDTLHVDGLSADDLLEWTGLAVDAGASERALDALQQRLDRGGWLQATRRIEATNVVSTASETADDTATAPVDEPVPRVTNLLVPDAPLDWARLALQHAKLALDLDLPRTARIDLEALAQRLDRTALPERLRLLRLQRRVGDSGAARQTVAGLLALAPEDPDVRLEAARLARAEADDTAARLHLDVARRRAAPGSDAADAVEQVQDAIDADHQVRAEVGLQRRHHPGSAGLGRLDSDEATVRLTWPQGSRTDLFVQVDRIDLDAGTLGADADSAGQLGRVALNLPQGLPAPSPQAARGHAIGVGWQRPIDRFDIGWVDVGLRRWVGGWRIRAIDSDSTGLTVNLSRRLLTDSLLTWGGAVDPSDGQRRGGVTLDAAQLALRQSLGPRDSLGASVMGGVLRGRDVVRNGTVQLHGDLNHDLVRSPSRRMRVGVDADLDAYGHNLSFYSAGHGGYYSPQRRLALAVPWELSGLHERLAYLLRTRVSYAWSSEADMPAYPGDPGAQTVAGNPPLRGGPGRGAGASLTAALEWRASLYASIGATLSAERSKGYAVTRGQVYLRHWFGRVPPPLDWPPQEVQPYVRR